MKKFFIIIILVCLLSLGLPYMTGLSYNELIELGKEKINELKGNGYYYDIDLEATSTKNSYDIGTVSASMALDKVKDVYASSFIKKYFNEDKESYLYYSNNKTNLYLANTDIVCADTRDYYEITLFKFIDPKDLKDNDDNNSNNKDSNLSNNSSNKNNSNKSKKTSNKFKEFIKDKFFNDDEDYIEYDTRNRDVMSVYYVDSKNLDIYKKDELPTKTYPFIDKGLGIKMLFEEAYKDSIKCEYPGTVEVDYGTEKIACVPMFFTYLHDDTHYNLFNILAFRKVIEKEDMTSDNKSTYYLGHNDTYTFVLEKKDIEDNYPPNAKEFLTNDFTYVLNNISIS